jgi:hypothetical protein
MDRVYGSRDHGWLSVHGGLTIMKRCGRSRAQEVIVIARREREKVIGVFTNDATWRRSCGDGHTTALNIGGRWCSDREIILGAGRRDWSRGECNGWCRRAVEGGRSRGGRQWWWNFNGTSYKTWKWWRGDDGVQPFSEGKMGRRRGSSIVWKADDTSKSACGSRGGRRRRLASGGQRWPKKIGSVTWMRSWTELLTKMMKKYGWKYEIGRKIGEGILTGQNRKEKKK